MARLPWWNRSSPWIGLLGGLSIGFWTHLGVDTESQWWLDTLGIDVLFGMFPLLGYAVLGAIGFGTGWIFRWIERRSFDGE